MISMHIGTERIRALQASGMLTELTKLYGLEEIGEVSGWSETKLRAKLEELQDEGVVFRELLGSPPRPIWCSYPSLILKYVSLKGQKREIL